MSSRSGNHADDGQQGLETVEQSRSHITTMQPSNAIVANGTGAESSGTPISRGASSNGAPGKDYRSRYPIRRRLFEVKSGKLDQDAVYSRIENPFRNWLPDQAEQVAKRIACEYGLENIQETFIKASRVLRDSHPKSWSSWKDHRLTEEERICLELEPTASFWDQPRALRTTFLMLFVGAVVQGWSQTGTNGANLSWWRDIGIGQDVTTSSAINNSLRNTPGGSVSTPICTPSQDHIWSYAAVNAAPYLAAAVGSHLSDPLINELLFGRRGAILLSAVLVLASSIGGAFAQSWWELLVCRIILGIGMGCKAAVVPVFAAEIAPAHLRGSLVMNWQVFDALGICLGFTANLITSRTGTAAWRWQIFSSAIPSFALLCGTLFISWDSPRYLMKHEERFRKYWERKEEWRQRKNRDTLEDCEDGAEDTPSPALPYRSEAFKTLVLLRGHPILAAKELMYAHCQLLVESEFSRPSKGQDMDFSLKSRSSWFGRYKQLFTKGYIRRELYAAAVVMIGQQLCGVNVLIFYSSTLFCDTGRVDGNSTEWQPLLQSWGLGLMNVVAAIPAYWLIDLRGRRWLLLATLPWLAFTMAAAAAGFTVHDGSDTRRVVVTAFTYIFMAFYSCGMGPVPFTLSAEIFPLEHRMVGMSLAVSLNFLGAGLETLIVPAISRPEYLLGGFAVLNVIAFIFVWMFVREVIGSRHHGKHHRMTSLNLEELFYIFQWPALEHIRYQWSVLLPHVLRRMKYIILYCFDFFADEPEEPDPFNTWANKRAIEKSQ